jgi:hypothetical protein
MVEFSKSTVKKVDSQTLPQDYIQGLINMKMLKPEDEIVSTHLHLLKQGHEQMVQGVKLMN